MFPAKKQWASSAARVAVLLSLSSLLLLLASCKDSQQPPAPVTSSSSWDPGATTLTFKLETPAGTLSPLRLIATDIIWAPGSGILRANVALHNAGTDTIPGPTTVEIFDFLPANVQPLNAVCGIIHTAPCFYEYDGSYGDDGLLAPGETSAALEWQILNTAGQGFRFRARLGGIADPGGRIAGVVFHDLNRDGIRGRNEPGIPGVLVSLGPMPTAPVRTNADGYFELRAPAPGIYTVHKNVSDDWQHTTPPDMQVVVFRDINGDLSNFFSADFGCWRSPISGPGVGGVVFHDNNRNGRRDPNEMGLGGYLISLQAFPPETRREELCGPVPPDGSPSRLPTSTFSDNQGNWFLPASDITCELPWLVHRGIQVALDVRQPPLPALFGTTPNDQVVHVLPGPGGFMQVDFGMAPADSSNPEPTLIVEGSVFVDSNGNGIRDANEPGARGVRLSLLSPCDRLESTWTNYFGHYRFEPPATAFCEIGGVAVTNAPDPTTTTNPILFPPPTVPGVHLIRANFGVRP